jgi:hypothetical protein
VFLQAGNTGALSCVLPARLIAPSRATRSYRPAMRFGPPVSYTHNQGGSRLAYQVLGDGDLDLVFLFGWPTHLALMWENPAFADFLRGLAAFSRLILFDVLPADPLRPAGHRDVRSRTHRARLRGRHGRRRHRPAPGVRYALEGCTAIGRPVADIGPETRP